MRKILAGLMLALLWCGSASAQVTRHTGTVEIQSTGAAALDVAGGIQVGSGNVAIVGTDGKINGPLSTTIIDDLSGVNLTSLNATNIASGTLAIARFPTGGTWTLASDLTLTAGGNVVALGTGPHGLGRGVTTSVQLSIGGTFAERTGVSVSSTVQPPANTNPVLLEVAGTIDEFSSGVHALVVGAGFFAPAVTVGLATVTDTATVYIEGPMGATVSGANYALRVDGGESRFDEGVTLGVDATTHGYLNTNDSQFYNIDSNNNATGNSHMWGLHRATDSGGTELMRLTEAGLLLLNVTTNGNMTQGITIQQTTNDNQAFALKSSTDVATGMTTLPLASWDVDTDDYFASGKTSGNDGGVYLISIAESMSAQSMHIEAWSGAPATGNSSTALGVMNFFVGQHDNANADVDMGAGANGFAFGEIDSAGARQSRMILDADTGNLWISGTLSGDSLAADSVDAGEIEADGVATSEILDGTVSTADLNTTTGSFSSTISAQFAMNDYSFFPNIENDDCLPRQIGAELLMYNADQSNDTIGRFGVVLPTTCTTSGSWDARWRYVTSSDRPVIWLIVEADGTPVVVWQSGDPAEQEAWPLNPNPLAGNVLDPGQRFVNVPIPDVSRLTALLNALDQSDRAGALARASAYVVDKRGWLDTMRNVAALSNVTPRVQDMARLETLRAFAAQVGIDPAELILELMVVSGQDELEWKVGLRQFLSDHLTVRAATRGG